MKQFASALIEWESEAELARRGYELQIPGASGVHAVINQASLAGSSVDASR